MRYWFDTEFIEKPCTIDLISIGVVSEDLRSFYAELSNVDWTQAHPWVLQHVKPHLVFDWEDDHRYFVEDIVGNIHMKGPRSEVGDALRRFLGYSPEMWAWYGAYDWVAFCWLQGTMVELPDSYPRYVRDLKQLIDEIGFTNRQLPQQTGTEHHALDDARWTKQAWEWVRDQFRPTL